MGRVEDAVAATWREQTLAYARAVNALVARGRREGFEQVGSEPDDPRSPELAREVLAQVRRANAEGRWRELRASLPPDHAPLAPLVDAKARPVRSLVFVDEDTVLATVGDARDAEVHRVGRDGSVAWVPPLVAIGGEATGRFVAFASAYDVEVRPRDTALDAQAGASPVFELPSASANDGPFVTSVTPSPDGQSALVVRDDGVFVCSSDAPRCVFPRKAPPKGVDVPLDATIHAALSPDGRFVALGAHGAQHLLVETATGEVLACFGPLHTGEPHLTAFSGDGAFVLVGAARNGFGVCAAAPVDALYGLSLPPFESDPRFVVVSAGARVDASSFHEHRFVLGDAQGYVRERGIDGYEGWQLHFGASVRALAWSPSGRHLAVGTSGGALGFFALGEPAPWQIGDARLVEELRIYFWRDEILRW